MPEERTLVANLVPQIDDADIQNLRSQLFDELSSEISINLNQQAQGDVAPAVLQETEVVEAIENLQETTADSFERIEKVRIDTSITDEELSDSLTFYLDSMYSILDDIGDAVDDISNESNDAEGPDYHKSFKTMLKDMKDDLTEKVVGKMGANGDKILAGITIAVGVVRIIFDLLKKAWDLLVSSSPFLRNILNLFNDALGLVLGPLGTAIGMELIPILKNLYERVMRGVQSIWKAYEEGGLGAMIMETFGVLWDVFAPLIPEILDVMLYITGEFIQKLGEVVWSWLVDGLRQWWDTSSLKVGVDAIVSVLEGIWDVLSGFTNGIGDVFSGVGDWFDSIWPFAEGGEVEASPPYGTIVRVGEKEREFIVPQSKVSSFVQSQSTSMGGNTYYNTYYISGYTDTDLTEKIENTMDRRIATSSLRGGL